MSGNLNMLMGHQGNEHNSVIVGSKVNDHNQLTTHVRPCLYSTLIHNFKSSMLHYLKLIRNIHHFIFTAKPDLS